MENVRITDHAPKNRKVVKCHQIPKTWSSAEECAKDLNVCVSTVYNACNGVTKGIRVKAMGKVLKVCYEEDVAKCRSMSDAELKSKTVENEKLKAELAAAQADALKWREYQAKIEAEEAAARRAEEVRQKQLTELRAKLERGEAREQKLLEELEELTAKYNDRIERNEIVRRAIAALEGSEE